MRPHSPSINPITPFPFDEGRVRILGAPIDNISMSQALARIQSFLLGTRLRQHVAVNVHKIVMYQRDPAVRKVLEECDLATADGQITLWAARLLGTPLQARITGIDLMEALLAMSAEKGYRVYFLGAPRDVLQQAVAHYQNLHPTLCVAGATDGYWRPAEEPYIVEAVRESDPDILFVALDSPRKEQFIHRYREVLGARFAMGVGGAFEVAAGRVRRAPLWVQHAGGEWLWRVVQEPSRLWKRYSSDGSAFVSMVFREWLGKEKRQ